MPQSPARVLAALNELRPPDRPHRVLGRAVVLGGSVAGLLAARVLADHAEQVLLLDRDELAGDGIRPGVPQGSQLHALLPGGFRQLEHLFPGFGREAVARGAVEAPPATRRSYLDGRRKVVVPDDLDSLAGTRPLLEGLIRDRVRELPAVVTRVGRATGLTIGQGAVTGVRCAEGAPEPADLVVDAMGRSSRLAEWLEQAGWERPPTRRMTVHLNYATVLFDRPEVDPELTVVMALHTPGSGPTAAGAAFFAVEQGRWMAMMAGYGEHRPGRTTEDFLRRLREDFPPEFGELAGRELRGPVRTYHHPDSRRRDYHELRRLPAGLVSVGDAVASFNPVYGQGITAAALHAACLARYLRSGPDLTAPARGFLDLQRVVVDAAWSTSTSADLALPHVAGPYPRGYRLSRWASRQIVTATVTDVPIARRFNDVVSMRTHPSSLATPGVLLRALRVNRTAR